MLYPLFQLDGDCYALNVTQTAEVLPLAATKSISGMSARVAGAIERHGAPVPATDMPQPALGRPARPLCSTRLVLARYEAGIRGDDALLLDLALEHATYARRINDASFAVSGVATPGACWLGPVASLDDGLVQRMDAEAILDAYVCASLLPAAIG